MRHFALSTLADGRGGTSGKPAFPFRNHENVFKIMKRDIQKTVRIWNADRAEELAQIQTLPQYKSANKALNDALDRGLPILYRELFGGESEPDEPARDEQDLPLPATGAGVSVHCPDSEFCWTVMLLLKEINLNVLLNKQMLSGIFRYLALVADGTTAEEFGKLLESGKINLTPDCLGKQETDGLKRITKLSGGKSNE